MTYNQAQEVAENRNGGRNDPCKNPQAQGDANPGAHSHPVALVHPVCATEDTYVDILEGDVTVDNTCNDDLKGES